MLKTIQSRHSPPTYNTLQLYLDSRGLGHQRSIDPSSTRSSDFICLPGRLKKYVRRWDFSIKRFSATQIATERASNFVTHGTSASIQNVFISAEFEHLQHARKGCGGDRQDTVDH